MKRHPFCPLLLLLALQFTADACSIMELKVASDFIPAGDHEVVICDVVDWKITELGDGSPMLQRPLYTGYLRREGYL
jgi:hypothetical protein